MGTTGELAYKSSAGRWVIAATVLGSGMAAIDATVVGIAVPTIGRAFSATIGTLQWVVTGYTLTLAALLLLGGSLGDRYGRRRVFAIGIVWFALSSAACGFAKSATMLIVARVVQGIGAALLTPGSLAILQASFKTDDRGRAIGAWSGLGGLASAVGPLLGGYLIAAASWRWIFFINLPVGAAVLGICARHVPESRDASATGRMDLVGAAIGMVSLAALTYGLIEGPSRGFTSAVVIGALATGLVGFATFVLVERSVEVPMLPLALFAVRQFSVTNVVTLVVYAALGGALFLLPVELQIVNHYSPLEAGAALIPLTVVMLLLSARSGQLAQRIGPRLQMGLGPVVVAGGMALLLRTSSSGSYASSVLPAVLVFALGLATTVAPLTTTAMGAAPADHAGIASAVNNYVARVGSLLAVAVLPALAGISGDGYAHASELSSGFKRAMIITASMCALGGVIAAIGIRNPAGPSRGAAGGVSPEESHCALDAPPLRDQLAPTTGRDLAGAQRPAPHYPSRHGSGRTPCLQKPVAPQEMTDAVRPSPPGSEQAELDRQAAFAAGPTRIPRKFVHWIVFAAAVLGIGGALLEHVLTITGINPSPPPTTTTVPATSTTTNTGAPSEHEATVQGALASFMGLEQMTPGEARPFSLLTSRGGTVALADERGKVVVLSFFDGRCNDICPVVAQEIEQADSDLGPLRARVSFITINTDPAATSLSGLDGVLANTGLGRLSNWQMLTGPLTELDTTWQDYGITVSFDTSTRTVEHNDLMYFLDTSGRFRFSATPSANEARPSGRYELSSTDIARFARGMATYAAELADSR